LHTTAESHHRIMVLEVMGRHAGWIATVGGIAGGADEILIPEEPFDIDEVCNHLKERYSRGKKFSIIVVAEGAEVKHTGSLFMNTKEKDDFGHLRLGGVGHYIAKLIEERMDVETRVTVLGHVQRGGSPTAYDRVLATRFGVAAVELIKNNNFGKMVALQGNKIVPIPLEDSVSKSKTVDKELYEIVWKNQERFVGFGSVDPSQGLKALDDVKRCIEEYGFKHDRIVFLIENTLVQYHNLLVCVFSYPTFI